MNLAWPAAVILALLLPGFAFFVGLFEKEKFDRGSTTSEVSTKLAALVFFSLVPLGVPILFLGLHVGVSLLQTYIFVLLTTVYLQGAVSDEH